MYLLDFLPFVPAPRGTIGANSRRLVDEVAAALVIAPKRDGWLFAATDGSSGQRPYPYARATYGVATESSGWAGRCHSVDQTSYVGERLGALLFLLAAAQAEVKFVLAIDNLEMQGVVESFLRGGVKLPTDATLEWRDVREAAHRCNRNSRCIWIPSHGKFEDWKPKPPFEQHAPLFRRLNDKADERAGDKRKASETDLRLP